jgi:hypoxanthine phosphoribosyltransferase
VAIDRQVWSEKMVYFTASCFRARINSFKGPTMSDEKNKFPSSFVSSQFVKYVDSKEIKGIVEALGNNISQKYQGQDLVLIGVLKGSMVFLADLVREIRGVKVYVDFVKLQAVGRSKENHGTICISKDYTTNLMDRNVLIVEEIVDTGRALSFLKKRILLSSPRSLEVVTLFDKPYKRTVNVQPDMTGKKIDDQFIVGYGLDLEDYGRNFEQLYYLRYPN